MGILTRTIANNLGENPTTGFNYRNFIINGKMIHARRGQSFTSNGYTLDRFTMDESTDGAVTVTQSGDVPANELFSSALKIDVTTADTSIAANKYCGLTQYIEGNNMITNRYGSSNAQNMMLSFWVKSNKTGIYCVRFVKEAGSETRYETPIEYTINASNTWEKKSISLSPTAGGTALITGSAGAIAKNASAGFRIQFTHAVGTDYQATNNTWVAGSNKMGTTNSVNLLDSTSNEWLLTGVQLEVGTSTTSFEHLPEDVELLRCQRYYYEIYSSRIYSGVFDMAVGTNYDAGQLFCMKDLPTTMRAPPSIVQTTGTDYLLSLRNGVQDLFDGFNGVGAPGYTNIAIFTSGAENQSGVAGSAVRIRVNNTAYILAANAEL